MGPKVDMGVLQALPRLLFLEESVAGRHVLHIGAKDASFARTLSELGAEKVTCLAESGEFESLAKSADVQVDVRKLDPENLGEDNAFDVIIDFELPRLSGTQLERREAELQRVMSKNGFALTAIPGDMQSERFPILPVLRHPSMSAYGELAERLHQNFDKLSVYFQSLMVGYLFGSFDAESDDNGIVPNTDLMGDEPEPASFWIFTFGNAPPPPEDIRLVQIPMGSLPEGADISALTKDLRSDLERKEQELEKLRKQGGSRKKRVFGEKAASGDSARISSLEKALAESKKTAEETEERLQQELARSRELQANKSSLAESENDRFERNAKKSIETQARRIRDLEIEVEAAERAREDAERRSRSVERELTGVQRTLESAQQSERQSRLDGSSEQHIVQLSSELLEAKRHADRERRELEQKLHDAERAVQDATRTYQRELADAKADLDRTDREQRRTRDEVERLTKQFDEVRTERDRLKADYDLLQASTGARDNHQKEVEKQLTKLQGETSAALGERDKLKTELDALEDSLRSQKGIEKELEKRVSVLEAEKAQAVETSETMAVALKGIESTLADAEQCATKAAEENAARLQDLQARTEAAEEKSRALQEKQDAEDAGTSELKNVYADVVKQRDALQGTIQSRDGEILALTDELDAAVHEAERTLATIDALHKTVAEKDQNLTELAEKIEELKAAKAAVEDGLREAHGARDAVQAELDAALAAAKLERGTGMAELETSQTRLTETSERLAALEKQLAETREERDELNRSQKDQLSDHTRAIEDRDRSLRELTADKERVAREKSNLEARLSAREEALADAQKRIDELSAGHQDWSDKLTATHLAKEKIATALAAAEERLKTSEALSAAKDERVGATEKTAASEREKTAERIKGFEAEVLAAKERIFELEERLRAADDRLEKRESVFAQTELEMKAQRLQAENVVAAAREIEEDYESRLAALTSELSHLHTKRSIGSGKSDEARRALEEKLAHQEGLVKDQQETLSRQKALIQEHERRITEIQAQSGKEQTTPEDIAELKKHSQQLQGLLDAAREELELVHTAMRAKASELQELGKELEQVKADRGEGASEIQQERDWFEQAAIRLEEEAQEASTTIQELRVEVNRLSEGLENSSMRARQEVQAVKAEAELIREENGELRSMHEALKQQLSEFRARQDEGADESVLAALHHEYGVQIRDLQEIRETLTTRLGEEAHRAEVADQEAHKAHTLAAELQESLQQNSLDAVELMEELASARSDLIAAKAAEAEGDKSTSSELEALLQMVTEKDAELRLLTDQLTESHDELHRQAAEFEQNRGDDTAHLKVDLEHEKARAELLEGLLTEARKAAEHALTTAEMNKSLLEEARLALESGSSTATLHALQLEEAQKELFLGKAERELLAESLAEARERLDDEHADRKDLADALRKATLERERLAEEAAELTKKVSQKSKRKKTNTKDLEKAKENLLAEKEMLESTCESMATAIEEKDSRIKSLEDAYDELNAKLAHTEKTTTAVTTTDGADSEKSYRAELKEAEQALLAKVGEVASLQMGLKRLRDDLSDAKAALKSATKEGGSDDSEMRKQIRELEKARTELEKENDEKNERINRLTERLVSREGL